MPRKPKKFYKKPKVPGEEEKPVVKKRKKKVAKQKEPVGISVPPPKLTDESASPRKSRPIAEQVVFNAAKERTRIKIASFFNANFFLLSCIGVISLVGIYLVIGQIKIYYAQVEKLEKEKNQLEAKYAQLEEQALLHPGSRDIYLQLASVSYQLQNKEKAKAFTQRALILDPNYEPALEFNKRL